MAFSGQDLKKVQTFSFKAEKPARTLCQGIKPARTTVVIALTIFQGVFSYNTSYVYVDSII
jgi:hypothetical protein